MQPLLSQSPSWRDDFDMAADDRTRGEPLGDKMGLLELQARIEAGRRRNDATAIRQLDGEEIKAQVAAGVVDGIALVLQDDKLVKAFWHKGYQELANHSTNGASQWIGRRMFTAAILAITTAGLIWLLRNGALK